MSKDRSKRAKVVSGSIAEGGAAEFVQHHRCVRLHSALSYIAPMDFLNRLAPQIWAARDRRLKQVRSQRAQRRAQLRSQSIQPATSSGKLACV